MGKKRNKAPKRPKRGTPMPKTKEEMEIIEILLNFMETHGDMSTPRIKVRKAKEYYVLKLWDQLTSELNKVGKPYSRCKWTKQWYDYKYGLQRKLIWYYSKGLLGSIELPPYQMRIREIMGLSDEKVKSLHDEWAKNVAVQYKAIPKSAKQYYLKLYRQNKIKSNNMQPVDKRQIYYESLDSWSQLPRYRKIDFILKHKQARDLKDLRIANYLGNAELKQLPKKRQSDACENEDKTQVADVGTVDEDVVDRDVHDDHVVNTDTHEEDAPKDIDHSTNHLISNDIEDSAPVMDASMDDNLSPPRQVEPPPPPPVVTTAEELYNLIQTSQELDSRPWASLPEVEKRQFHRAITSLKKDNLRQYRSYLHNLSSEDLHKHMVQTLFSDVI